MRSLFQTLFVVALLIFGYGCATVIHGTTQKIPVSSDPSGANITIAGEDAKYTTPCQVELKRKHDHVLKFEKEGCEPTSVEVKHVMSGAVAGNILVGGLIGVGIDASNGATFRLTPETINVTLKKVDPPQPEQPPSEAAAAVEPTTKKSVIDELDELDQMKKDGKITKRQYNTMRKKIIDSY